MIKLLLLLLFNEASLEVDDIYFDNDVPGIKMLPLSGTSSFIVNKNLKQLIL